MQTKRFYVGKASKVRDKLSHSLIDSWHSSESSVNLEFLFARKCHKGASTVDD